MHTTCSTLFNLKNVSSDLNPNLHKYTKSTSGVNSYIVTYEKGEYRFWKCPGISGGIKLYDNKVYMHFDLSKSDFEDDVVCMPKYYEVNGYKYDIQTKSLYHEDDYMGIEIYTGINLSKFYENKISLRFPCMYMNLRMIFKYENNTFSIDKMNYLVNVDEYNFEEPNYDNLTLFVDSHGKEFKSYDDYFDSLVEISPDINKIWKTKVSGVSFRYDGNDSFTIFYEIKKDSKCDKNHFSIYCALYNKKGKIKAQKEEYINFDNGSTRIAQHCFYNVIKFTDLSKVFIYVK